MPAIKITLKRLIELFGKSTTDIESLQVEDSNVAALQKLTGGLAARLMTLTAHTIRIDQKGDALAAQIKALSGQIATLTDIVQALAQPEGAPSAVPAPAVSAETPAAAASTEASAEESEEGDSEEDDEAAFFAKVQQEAEAEVAKINANLPPEPEPAPVAVLPRSKKAGGSK